VQLKTRCHLKALQNYSVKTGNFVGLVGLVVNVKVRVMAGFSF